MASAKLPSNLVIVAGTYDGVLAGWENDNNDNDNDSHDNDDRNTRSISSRSSNKDGLKMTMATAVHQGSVRGLALASSSSASYPGTLVSCGYDETLRMHEWSKKRASAGEVKTPSGFGTPSVAAFAPPNSTCPSHCVVAFDGEGKIAIYKKRDWAIHHVLAGHDGGVAGMAVHPSGKLCLTGGQRDGKVKLWDLTKGRLAFVNNVVNGKAKPPVVGMVWTKNGAAYGWAHRNHVTVRSVATGKDLLDADVPGRINDLALIETEQGLFVVAACNDGSLPVLQASATPGDTTVRAVLAIEPVDGPVAGAERFKCIEYLEGYNVVTANSNGVISVMNLQGAINMILTGDEQDDEEDENEGSQDDDDDDDDSDGDEEDVELAVDILASVRLGTGARVTCISAWCSPDNNDKRIGNDAGKAHTEAKGEPNERLSSPDTKKAKQTSDRSGANKLSDKKRKPHTVPVEEMDDEALRKARALVKDARQIQKKTTEARKRKRRKNKKQ